MGVHRSQPCSRECGRTTRRTELIDGERRFVCGPCSQTGAEPVAAQNEEPRKPVATWWSPSARAILASYGLVELPADAPPAAPVVERLVETFAPVPEPATAPVVVAPVVTMAPAAPAVIQLALPVAAPVRLPR